MEHQLINSISNFRFRKKIRSTMNDSEAPGLEQLPHPNNLRLIFGAINSLLFIGAVFGKKNRVLIDKDELTRTRTGNPFIMYLIACDSCLRRSPPFLLILNTSLCTCNLLTRVILFYSKAIAFGQEFWINARFACSLISTINVLAVVAILLTTLVIGANRYCLILRPALYKKLFSFNSTAKMCALSWSIGLLVNSIKLTGVFTASFDRRVNFCFLKYSSPVTSVVLALFLVISTMSLNGFFYYKILANVRARERRLGMRRIGLQSDSNRLIKSLFAQYVLYLVTWTPSTVVFQPIVDVPDWADFSFTSLNLTQTAVAPLLYFLFNYRIRASIKKRFS
nr:G protein-coupled receptor [Proales similis]